MKIFVPLVFSLLLVARADEMVTIEKSRLDELQKKAAQVEKLTHDLAAAREEISRLKGEAKVRPASVYTPALPPAVDLSIRKLPPTRPIDELPPVGKGEVVHVSDLLHHYAAYPVRADKRYKNKRLKISGVATDLEKNLFNSSYSILFRIPDCPLRLSAEVRPSDIYEKVYLAHERQQITGETRTSSATLATVGEEANLEGACQGIRDGVIHIAGCVKLNRP